MKTRYAFAKWFTRFAIGFALGLCFGCKQKEPQSVSIPALVSISNIVFTEFTGPESKTWQHITIRDESQIRNIVSFTQLKTKRPCSCAHAHEALLEGAFGNLRVSFCDHCFDVAGGDFHGTYRMPREFYAEFRKLAQQAPGEAWMIAPERPASDLRKNE